MKNELDNKSYKLVVLHNALRFMARVTLLRHSPYVVGITGSIGKTGTTEAVIHILSEGFSVRGPHANYNNEIGLPLTIIGAQTGGKTILGWIGVASTWLRGLFSKYPEILVLEYGIDHPGDMEALLEIVRPHVGVLTHVSAQHSAFFQDVAQIGHEKGFLIEKIKQIQGGSYESVAIINADIAKAREQSRRAPVECLSYGFKEGADFFASDIQTITNEDGVGTGLSFKVNAEGQSVPIRLENIIASHQIYTILAAIAVARAFKMNLVDIASRVRELHAPAGRMRLHQGKNDSLVIDDTYNAAPDAMLAAITTLSSFPGNKKYAVLGDMLELGDQEGAMHEKIIKRVVREKIDVIVLLGSRMAAMASYIEASGYDKEAFVLVSEHDKAITWLQERITARDVVLVKGAQGMRMEKIVSAIVNDDIDLEQELVRQSADWQNKTFMQP